MDFLRYYTRIKSLTGAIISETYTRHKYIYYLHTILHRANLLENLTGTGSTDFISWELKNHSPEAEAIPLTGSK